MNGRQLAALAVIAIVGLAPVHVASQSAESAALPRTPWGDPDLQGQWTNATTTPLERPAELAGQETLTDEELAVRDPEFDTRISFDSPHRADRSIYEVFMERGHLIRQTSLIIDPPDGKLPALTQQAQRKHNEFVARWHGASWRSIYEVFMERGHLIRQTSLIIDPPDGKLPALTQQAQRKHNVARWHAPTTWQDDNMFDRCITRGLPGAMIPGFYNHNYLILQTPDYVVVQIEMIHDARIIPLDGRSHVATEIRQWLGDPRGHWEGDTLVVETTNFTRKAEQRAGLCGDVGCGALQAGAPDPLNIYFPAFSTGENLHLVERFTRTDSDTIDYRFTVTDPTVDTRPWTASIPMTRTGDALYEYACHEGNYSLPLGLSGARADERKLAEEAEKGSR